ncbi:cleavage and polyadenylation specificity factor subunit [Trifolium repens]|nr:cleavage and polyadenylation specificity factor subunit [Trifolium repens]
MVDAITMMANALAQETVSRTAERLAQENLRGNEDETRLERFLKNNPQAFNGGHNPDGAQKWLENMEKIFGAMRCSETQKVTLGTYMLQEDANYWWKNTCQRLGQGGAIITLDIFKREFLTKYFPTDMRNRKVVEFMELKQGNLSVAEYATKFEDICRFCPHYNTVEAEGDRCVKFESGLRPDLKQLVSILEIRNFANLVNKSNICDLDGKAKTSYYKEMNDKKERSLDRGKPYDKRNKGKVGGSGEKGKNANDKCYKCGVLGHRFYDCPKGDRCFKCGEFGHKADVCKKKVSCFNCGEEGHKSPECKKPKKAVGKLFALSGDGAEQVDNLIRGTCFIYDTPLIAIVDTGATHSFISFECMKRLNIHVSEMLGCMEIETPAIGSVTTQLVCRNCPVVVFGKSFGMDLVCIPHSGIDVIFGINWLIFNRVHINCCEKTVTFPKLEEDSKLMSGKEVSESLKEHGELFAMFASLKLENEVGIKELPVVQEFPEVFPEDVSEMLLEQSGSDMNL